MFNTRVWLLSGFVSWFSLFFLFLVPYARLSWLSVSFWVYVRQILSRIVSYLVSSRTPPPGRWTKCCDERVCVSVCLSVCLFVRSHIWKTVPQRLALLQGGDEVWPLQLHCLQFETQSEAASIFITFLIDHL